MKKILYELFDYFDFRNNAIIALAIYFCLSFVFSDFNISILYGVILLFIYLMFEIIQFFLSKESKNIIFLMKKWKLFIIILFIVLLTSLNQFVIDYTKIYYILVFILSFLMIFFSNLVTIEQIHSLTKIFVIFSVLFSTVIFFYELFPKMYMQYIFPIISNSSQSYILRTTLEGYSVSFSGDISYTLNLISIGSCFLLVDSKGVKNQKMRVVLNVYFFLAILVSQRRTELLFFVITCCICILLKYKDNILRFSKNNKRILIYIMSFILLLIIGFTMYIFSLPMNYKSNSRVIQTFIDLKNGLDITNGRSALYLVALTIIKQHPFFGVGWMNYSKYAGITGNIHARNVHCIYLQLLCEIGVVLTLFVLYLFFKLLKQTYLLSKKDKYQYIPLSIQIYILLAGIIDNTLYYPYFWIIMMLISSIAFNKVRNEFIFEGDIY